VKFNERQVWDNVICLADFDAQDGLELTEYMNIISHIKPKQNSSFGVNKFTKRIIERELERGIQMMADSWEKIFDTLDPISEYPCFLFTLIASEDVEDVVEFVERKSWAFYNTLADNENVENVHVLSGAVTLKLDKYKSAILVGVSTIDSTINLQSEIKAELKLERFTAARGYMYKSHRSNGSQDICAVNDMHSTQPTTLWPRLAPMELSVSGIRMLEKKLKSSEKISQAITKCAFNANGQIFANAIGFSWSKGHEFYDNKKKTHSSFSGAVLMNNCDQQQ
jgi:hypothetical protein